MKIYILYDYEEHGPGDYVITTDPAQISRLYDELWPFSHDRESYQARLQECLAKDEIGNHDLGRGWGGPSLIIAETDTLYGQAWQKEQQEIFRAKIGWKPPK